LRTALADRTGAARFAVRWPGGGNSREDQSLVTDRPDSRPGDARCARRGRIVISGISATMVHHAVAALLAAAEQ
jgi:hypothetical protein